MSLLPSLVIQRIGLPALLSASFAAPLIAQDVVRVDSPVEGFVTWTVDDGVNVKEGDLLVRLDAGRFKEDRSKARVDLAQAESALLEKRAQVQMAQLSRGQELASAEWSLEMAEMRMARTKAAVALEQQTLMRRLELAKATLEVHQEQYAVAQQRVENGVGSADDLRDVRLAMLESMAQVEEAEGLLGMHKEYDAPMALRKAEFEGRSAAGQLKRTHQKVEMQATQDEARLSAIEMGIVLAQQRLERIEKQLAGCEIHAPASGKTSLSVTVGARVRERQPLLHLIAQ